MDFEKSETKKNLETALTGEAIAHLKYQYYQKKLTEINQKYKPILDEIIHNEKEHGEIWFKKLHDNNIPNNEINLLDAIAGEKKECHELYTSFGKTAKNEGFNDIAELFFNVAKIECDHANQFKEILNELDTLFTADKKTAEWKCLNCGHITEGKQPPLKCPVCNHPRKYFTKI